MAILDDTRDDWNARPPLWALTRVPWAERIGVSWHWIGPGKGPSAAGSHQRCLDQVRDWQAQHQDPNGRIRGKDIGYNVLICQHARAIEGRGLQYAGAHSPGVNYVHVGVQFMVGTDTPGGVTPAMYARAVRLRADIGALGKNIRRDWGHRDDPEASTSCPGDGIHKWVHSGGPTTSTTQEDEVTPQDIQAVVDGVLGSKVIPANMLVSGWKEGDPTNLVAIPRALDLVMRWALEGRDNAIVARTVAEAQAQLGRPMSAEEVSAAVKSALSEAARIEVVVKPEGNPA